MNKNIKQGLLSVFIIYHLAAVIVVPNYNSILGDLIGSYFIKYMNSLSLSTPWQFFSPDPSVKVFWEYTLDLTDDQQDGAGEDQKVNDEIITQEMQIYRWPPKESQGFYRVSFYRKMYQSRITSMPEENFQNLFIYWLCKKHPHAYGINIRTRWIGHPSLDSNRLSEVIESLKKQREKELEVDWPFKNYSCNRNQKSSEES